MKHIKGNLLDLAASGEFDIIVQGCNCFNTMGSGIARSIRERFPDAWLADQETLAGDRNKLGSYTIGMSGRLVIINAYTQYGTAKHSGEDVFEYKSFGLVLDKLVARFGKYKIGLPMIGMGLAGGNPEIILPMIEDFAAKMAVHGGSVTVVEFEQ